ncbi:MAG: HAD-IC family P-type ATPase [Candidatus Moranbacteria bacterium]|nr:HAD-IC family P-type ATPase [Candidatus Moranbacteria bacterium]
MKTYQFAEKKINECFEILKSAPGGISSKEASLRLKENGLNEIKPRKTTGFEILLRQLKSPFIYLLVIGGIITFAVGENMDGIFIFSFIIINVLLGFLQEFKSEKTIGYLQKYFSQKTKVLRNGSQKIIDKNLIVPGDIISLEAGDISPADLRLIHSKNLLIDESILSGESAPVRKNEKAISSKIEMGNVFDAKNLVMAGTSAVGGIATGVVVNTGKNTVFGEIAKQASATKRESIYEKDVFYFSKMIMKIIVSTIFIIFLANLFIKKGENLFEFSLFSIALIVSILPEALPTVVTFALARGGFKMAKDKVVVRRMTAIEDLGNIEILCTDKTGTLTQNKLQLEKVVSSNKNLCTLYGLLTSEIMRNPKGILNSFDSAIFQKANQKTNGALNKFNLISNIPFDSFRMMETVIIDEIGKNENLIIAKGAPEILLEKASSIEGEVSKKEILQQLKQEGENGRRTLGIAYRRALKGSISKKDEGDFIFLGYFTFIDPLKKTAKKSLTMAENLGIRVKIITGDSSEVSRYVAMETGIINENDQVVTGNDLKKMSTKEFDICCDECDVFARISPDMKLKIIKSLQKKYEVGFLGEGINDAPALKASNVGIVVTSASDVSREVSDIILLEKDLGAIVKGIKQGRNVFNNINKYIKCTLASNFGNFYSIAIISLFIPFLPMLPVQILLGNLFTDFPLISIVGDFIDPEEAKKPKSSRLQSVLFLVIILALISTFFDLIFFSIFHKSSPGTIQTLWFIESVLSEILLIFIIRTRHSFLKAKRPSFQLIFFSALTVTTTLILPFSKIGQEVLHFQKPPTSGLLIVIFLLISYFIASESAKLSYFKAKDKANQQSLTPQN